MKEHTSRARRRELDAWWSAARITIGAGAKLAFRFRCSGVEHLPATGGALLCYNHVSVLDPIPVAVAVTDRGRIVKFMALTEDFDRPVVGWTLRRLGQIRLRRGAGDWAAIEDISRHLKDGFLAAMSPEGTVGDGDGLLPGQKGAARVALTAQAPVVPVGVWGTQHRWPRSGLRLGPPARPIVAVVFGPPIPALGDQRSRLDVRSLTDGIMAGVGDASARARIISTDPMGERRPSSAEAGP